MADVGVEMFRHNLWANLRLLDNCAQLSDDDLDATVSGTYGSVRNTLVHMSHAEANYLSEFTKTPHNQPTAADPFPGFEKLREYIRTSGQALVDIAKSNPDERVLTGTYRDQPYEMPASILLVQAINHATEHRAHILSILEPRGVASGFPWRLDGVAYFQTGANA
ncbi:MAG: DinB family protein [Chloroflexota bacterium]